MFEEIGNLINHKEEPGNLDRAVQLLEQLKREHPENDVVRGKLAHAHFYKGYLAPEGSKERERFFDRGRGYGHEAITLNPRALYGNYWFASNLGMLGLCRGIMASLRSIDPYRKSMSIVLDVNERFFFGGPHRGLGRLYHQAPGWPISVGNKAKAADHFERAVEIAPDFIHNRLLLVELYLDVGKKSQAREHLEWILKVPIKPEHRIEDGEYRSQAERLYRKFFEGSGRRAW
jgi:tetratricopeptide (TPR) repeat protein